MLEEFVWYVVALSVLFGVPELVRTLRRARPTAASAESFGRVTSLVAMASGAVVLTFGVQRYAPNTSGFRLFAAGLAGLLLCHVLAAILPIIVRYLQFGGRQTELGRSNVIVLKTGQAMLCIAAGSLLIMTLR